jgi:ribosomal protein L11 methyltransferase
VNHSQSGTRSVTERPVNSISDKADPVWLALDLMVGPDSVEACEYGLMEAGALGTETNMLETGHLQVTGYFTDSIDEAEVRRQLLESFRIYNLPIGMLPEPEWREVANRDWLAEWKKSWQPVEVGERFLIAPPWSEIPDAGDRIVIRIEPGMAFGTGTHETTRLCLVAIERHFTGGCFLDVGTGTGILAMAAAKLFPEARIEACDTDGEAIAIARENAMLNHVAGNISFHVGSVEVKTASADCVCANLTAETILPLLPALLGATCGRLILSGILVEQTESIRLRLSELGIQTGYEVVSDGEWAAFII